MRQTVTAVTAELERRAALTTLLELPDPPELRARGHRLTCEGHPRRHAELVVRLMHAYTQWRYVDLHGEEVPQMVAARAWVC